jgi:hypothetical protein
MTRLTTLAALTLFAFLMSAGCNSTHEKDVSSTMRKQWTDVAANTKTTTDAAKSVLEAEGLKSIEASSTAMDGKASGMMADGTKVNVGVKKKTDSISEVIVVVGSMGDPKLGAEFVRKIQLKAEAK